MKDSSLMNPRMGMDSSPGLMGECSRDGGSREGSMV